MFRDQHIWEPSALSSINFTSICEFIEMVIEIDNLSLFSKKSSPNSLFDEYRKLMNKVIIISNHDYSTTEVMQAFEITKWILNRHLPIGDALEDFVHMTSIAINNEGLSHYQRLEVMECFEACLAFDHNETMKAVQVRKSLIIE